MKLHCFAGFWTRRTIEEEGSSPWIFGGVNNNSRVKIVRVPPERTLPAFAHHVIGEVRKCGTEKILETNIQEELMARRQERICEDLRDLIKNKAEKHKNYFRSLIESSSSKQLTSRVPTQMADRVPAVSLEAEPRAKSKSATIIRTNPPSGSPAEGTVCKRQRRQGIIYGRETLESNVHHHHQEETIFKSVKQLRDEYLAMLVKTTKNLGSMELITAETDDEKPKEKSKRLFEASEHLLLVPPPSDYCSSSASGASDDEHEKTNWHRKHKVARCGSSDSAMGQSDEDVQATDEETKDCNTQSSYSCSYQYPISPYSPRGSIDHSSVPSKIIIEAQTVLFPIDRKCSMDCVSEDTDFDPNDSRRQSCFTDDGDDASRYRYWRTPSVVVSDYSDDIMGLTLEDIEYIRSHRKENSSSPDSSLHSSCSNLNYCGSTISGLDSEYVLTRPYRKSSNCSTCSTLSGDEEQESTYESTTTDTTLRPHNIREILINFMSCGWTMSVYVSFLAFIILCNPFMFVVDYNIYTSSRSPSPASTNASPRASPGASPRCSPRPVRRKVSFRRSRSPGTPQTPTSPNLGSRRGSYTGYEQYQKSLLEVPLYCEYGDPSSDDLSSEWESERDEPNRKDERGKSSGWRKLRNIVQWTPFFQTYKKHRYPWVQLAGHQGNFKAGPDQGTILKKLCVKEEKCFQVLMKDVLRPYVPEYKGLVASDDGESEYIQLQDLLGDFISPCVMDCKIGVRTYLEEELAKAKEKPKLRKDMYEKMCQIDETAPTEEEHRLKGVTKPRYMVWRETISSTATLGFRIEGVRNSDGTSSKDFKTTKAKEQIMEAFQNFTDGFPHAVPKYIQRLKAIKATLEQSKFFETHEVIGSSLLFVHDRYNANVWLIDFAKTLKLPSDVNISHNSKWKVGNHEDGYLIGINNLIKMFMTVLENQPIHISPPLSLQDPPELTAEVEREMKQKADMMENT